MEALMKVSEAMTREVRVVSPEQSIREAAQLMMKLDSGVLPVAEGDRLIGMITDRDITVRAVAAGRGPETHVRDVMSAEVKYAFDDQPVEEVTRNMADLQVRRLPVVNRDKRLVGILSLGDLASNNLAAQKAGEALRGISRPGGDHSQSGAIE
jgi:CBS domain-containing protein